MSKEPETKMLNKEESVRDTESIRDAEEGVASFIKTPRCPTAAAESKQKDEGWCQLSFLEKIVLVGVAVIFTYHLLHQSYLFGSSEESNSPPAYGEDFNVPNDVPAANEQPEFPGSPPLKPQLGDYDDMEHRGDHDHHHHDHRHDHHHHDRDHHDDHHDDHSDDHRHGPFDPNDWHGPHHHNREPHDGSGGDAWWHHLRNPAHHDHHDDGSRGAWHHHPWHHHDDEDNWQHHHDHDHHEHHVHHNDEDWDEQQQPELIMEEEHVAEEEPPVDNMPGY